MKINLLQHKISLFALLALGFMMGTAQAEPPFSGTIFIDPDIITETDPSAFKSVQYIGQDLRTMYDRRVEDWIDTNAYLFTATYKDGPSAEIQVNPEFESADGALIEAQYYGWVIGQLPASLRLDIETVWIHKGNELFGGGNNNILIHTGQAANYIVSGILEETLVHEAAHTSLDETYASAPGWLDAQILDDGFISTYARDNPNREDIAESYLTYLAFRYRSDRVSDSLLQSIVEVIPNRIAYFDSQSVDMYPIIGKSNDDLGGNETVVDDDSFSLFIPIVAVGDEFYSVSMEIIEGEDTSIWQVTSATTVPAIDSKNISGTFFEETLNLSCVVFRGNRYKVAMNLVNLENGYNFDLLSVEDASECSINTVIPDFPSQQTESYLDSEYYHLSTDFRGPTMRLDVYNGGTYNNMTHLEPIGDLSGQFWKITPTQDGWYTISSQFRGPDMCLDIYNGGQYNNMPYLTNCANFSGQFWQFILVDAERYKLITMFRGEDMCLDIYNGGQYDNMPHLTPCANFTGQLWTLSPAQ